MLYPTTILYDHYIIIHSDIIITHDTFEVLYTCKLSLIDVVGNLRLGLKHFYSIMRYQVFLWCDDVLNLAHKLHVY